MVDVIGVSVQTDGESSALRGSAAEVNHRWFSHGTIIIIIIIIIIITR